MPKYWGKQIFAHGRFPEVGQKQKTEEKKEEQKLVITMAKLRMAHASTLAASKPPWPKSAFYGHHSVAGAWTNPCPWSILSRFS